MCLGIYLVHYFRGQRQVRRRQKKGMELNPCFLFSVVPTCLLLCFFLKTINGDDILFALQEMGFDNYVEPMRFYLSKYRESQPALDEKNERPVKKRAKKEQDGGGAESSSSSGLPGNAAAAMAMQQQLAMQQMMSMQGLIPGLMPMGMGSGGGELSPEQSAMLAQMQVTGGFGGMPMPPMFATQPPLQQGGPMPTSVVDGSGGENL